MDSRLSLEPSVNDSTLDPACAVCWWLAWASRKPLLSLRLSVSFLLRFDARRFAGLLFQEPPRITRRTGSPPRPDERLPR